MLERGLPGGNSIELMRIIVYSKIQEEKMSDRIDRREFIKRSSSAMLGAGVAFGSGFKLGAQDTQAAKVVEVKHSEVLQSGRILDPEIVRNMVEVLNDEKRHRKMIQNAQNTKGIFTWQKIGKMWERMFKKLL